MQGNVRERLEAIGERIERAAHRAGRDPSEIRLVAAAKGVRPDRVQEAVDAGIRMVGENYVQEARRLREGLGRVVEWHMIGHLQTNKARQAVEIFDVIETVDRSRIVTELQRHAHRRERHLGVLVQVNLSGEETKSGAGPDLVLSLIEAIEGCENLRCLGLMTIPPLFDDPEKARPYFSSLRELRDRLVSRLPRNVPLRELSMGMSGDFEVAIEEGATWVRIGTALFGPRRA